MKIGILGSGMVGRALGTKLTRGGHDVKMGSRSAGHPEGEKWRLASGARASAGTFAEAADFGEIVVNATNGANALAALRLAGAEALRGKILIDVAVPLDFSRGFPPSLTAGNTDSLGEQIQREFPDVRVVKTLNTMNCDVMVEPGLVPGAHQVFVCGDDRAAKAEVATRLHEWFGWPAERIIDLGELAAARGTEGFLLLWLRLYAALGHAHFNLQIQAAPRG
jgi:predicted dinucleotide-binding enzyme